MKTEIEDLVQYTKEVAYLNSKINKHLLDQFLEALDIYTEEEKKREKEALRLDLEEKIYEAKQGVNLSIDDFLW